MARILAIDYGTKRTGLAVTDPLQIIASALETISTPDVLDYIKTYCLSEDVERILLGFPVREDGKEAHSAPHIRKFAIELDKLLPSTPIEFRDESYTSQEAMKVMIRSGASKKTRRTKGNLDKISATLILQEYLEEISL